MLTRISQRWIGGVGLSLSIIVMFSACSVAPVPKKDTAMATPDHWLEQKSPPTGLVLDPAWWNIFRDPVLDALERQTLAANPDIAGAMARIAEAQALVKLASADKAIALNFGSAASHDRTSENDKLPPFFPIETNRVRAAFDTSYEVDAWGRVKSTIAAAKGEVMAAEADLATVRLSITGEVARLYCELCALQSEADLLTRLARLKQDAYDLQQVRYKAGLIIEVDTIRAKIGIANIKTTQESLQRQIAVRAHALATLAGQAPVAFNRPELSLSAEKFLPELPILLPASVLKRRPDVAAADARIDVALARMGIARTAFFPQIKLTGSFGFESADLTDLLKWPSRIWSIGPGISLPLLDGGRNRANYAAAQARYEESVASYRKTILSAFGEVENALSDLQWLARQIASVGESATATRESADLIQARVDSGLANSLEAIEAEQSVVELDRVRAQLRGQQFVATIAFAKALGGGWSAEGSKISAGNQPSHATALLVKANEKKEDTMSSRKSFETD